MALSDALKDPSVADAAEVARALHADLQSGLSSEEAARRLAQEGRNELRAAAPVPVWRKLLAQFQDPLIYLLLVAMMFMGRVGPLTLAVAIARQAGRARVRYPEGRILIG